MKRKIAVLGDVRDLSDLLEGASVDQARLAPSGGWLRLEMELTRVCSELQPTGRRNFLSPQRRPWIKSRLTLNQITEVSFQRSMEVPEGQPSLLACDAVRGGYTVLVTSHDGLRLSLTIEQLNGEFADIGQPVEAP